METHPKWMSDPAVSHIDPAKLDFLNDLAANGRGKSQREMMTYVMSVMKKAKEQKLTFSADEIQTIIATIKKHSTPKELSQMDEILKKASSAHAKQ